MALGKPKYKIGDILVCVDNKNPQIRNECEGNGGSGFVSGYKSTIQKITDNGRHYIYWPFFERDGVYEPFLKRVNYNPIIENLIKINE